jgi:hypothetical protein
VKGITIRASPGETIVREARFRSTDGTPINLTGASISIDVPGFTPTLIVQITNATQGRVVIRQSDTDPITTPPGTYRGRLTLSMPTSYGIADVRVVPVVVHVGGE